MLPWLKVRKVVLRYFATLRWYNIVLALLFYTFSSWGLLNLANETALLNFSDFFYWLIVTGSTVGYGDMSPSTATGKWIVALYIIPMGLSIFALVVGRVAAWVSIQWQRGVKGLKPLNVSDHILLIGWNGQRTQQLLRLMLKEREYSEDNPDIVLCVRADIMNPMPSDIEFVRVATFNKNDDMDKACVADARTIIVDNPEDDMTLTTALYCAMRNPNAHMVAYFQDESLVDILKQHCPQVECTPSVAVEMLVKSAFDPGSSLLHHDLLSAEDGQAQFSIMIPNDVDPFIVEDIFLEFKNQYDATFIGFSKNRDAHEIDVNPAFGTALLAGYKLFYIGNERIKNVNWAKLHRPRKEAANV